MDKVWVLTSEYNEYDQYGEYFIKVFFEKPSVKDLQNLLDCDINIAEHILNGGGRRDTEYLWYFLREKTNV